MKLTKSRAAVGLLLTTSLLLLWNSDKVLDTQVASTSSKKHLASEDIPTHMMSVTTNARASEAFARASEALTLKEVIESGRIDELRRRLDSGLSPDSGVNDDGSDQMADQEQADENDADGQCSDSCQEQESLLGCAVRCHQLSIIELLLARGAKIGMTQTNLLASDEDKARLGLLAPLAIAALKGDLETYRLLRQHGAKIRGDFLSPAAAGGSLEITKDIMDNCGSYEKIESEYPNTWREESPMEIAVTRNHKEIIKLFLDRGANFDEIFEHDASPSMLSFVQEECGISLSQISKDSSSMASIIQSGENETLEKLIKSGFTLDNDMDGSIFLSNSKTLKLLENQINPESFKDHENILTAINNSKDPSLIDIMIRHGADISTINPETDFETGTDSQHERPENLGIHPDVLDYLCRHGMNIPSSPYYLMVQYTPKQIDILIKNGFNLSTKNQYGHQLLDLALAANRPELANHIAELMPQISIKQRKALDELNSITEE